MQLIGMLDSPFVRRVAISLQMLKLPYTHQSVSVFRHFEQFRSLNPLVKAPSLICDDGTVLMDSTLILDYLNDLVGEDRLMPATGTPRRDALRVLGLALAACEKTMQSVYERNLRPDDKLHQPWLDRITLQLRSAYDALEEIAAKASPWLFAEQPLQPDITLAVSWRFTQFYLSDVITAADYPHLAAFSTRAEALPEFLATPLE